MIETAGPSASSAPLPRMTFEEFLNWQHEAVFAEWVDGDVVFMSPTEDRHQFLVGWLFTLMNEFVIAHQLGIVLMAPFLMRLSTRPSGREPDLLFLADAHLARNRKTYLDGPADLVVEVVSKESAARDRGDKYYEYEQAGVREYWLLDRDRKQADFFQLDTNGIFRGVLPDAEGLYHSVVLQGFNLQVDWLWQDPLPSTLGIFKAWGLI